MSCYSNALYIIALSVALSGCEMAIETCGDAQLERTMYREFSVDHLQSCESEVQYRQCVQGQTTAWSGDYHFPTCQVNPEKTGALPRWQFSQLNYAGGFRVTAGPVGDGENSILGFSPGIFTIDTQSNTLFTVSHSYEQGFGEMPLPALTFSEDPTEFEVSETPVQRFVDIYQTDRDVTGIKSYFRVSGLHKIDNQLLVNYFNWYDAGGTETDTTMIFKDAQNLATSDLVGPFQLAGAAHAAGWFSDIPSQWQASLGGTHIVGMSQGSIVSRLSVGPSAFIWSAADKLLTATEGGDIDNAETEEERELAKTKGALETTAVMDFSLGNMMYNAAQYAGQAFSHDDMLYNRIDGNNNLWTINSSAKHAFIIPNTSTYFVIGSSSGHHSGLGYKITQDSGRVCPGPCPYQADDYYNYYWLFDVNDFVRVLNNEIEPHEILPYDYGEFNTINNKANIAGGYYHAGEHRLYLSLGNGDPVPQFGKPPLFLAYDL